VAVSARMANVAIAAAGRDVVLESVELPEVIAVESMEDAQKVPLFMAPDDCVLVQIAANGVRTHVHQLQAGEASARCRRCRNASKRVTTCVNAC
jgi:hypothetical protein